MGNLIFIVDENNIPLSPQRRRDAVKARLWRRTGGGIIWDKERELVLCHRRSLRKDERGGLWVAVFGGKSDPGESSSETAARELFEEFGINAYREQVKIKFIGCVKCEERRQFEYSFIVSINSVAVSMSVDENEVMDTKWIGIDELIDRLLFDSRWYSYGFEIDALKMLRGEAS